MHIRVKLGLGRFYYLKIGHFRLLRADKIKPKQVEIKMNKWYNFHKLFIFKMKPVISAVLVSRIRHWSIKKYKTRRAHKTLIFLVQMWKLKTFCSFCYAHNYFCSAKMRALLFWITGGYSNNNDNLSSSHLILVDESITGNQ